MLPPSFCFGPAAVASQPAPLYRLILIRFSSPLLSSHRCRRGILILAGQKKAAKLPLQKKAPPSHSSDQLGDLRWQSQVSDFTYQVIIWKLFSGLCTCSIRMAWTVNIKKKNCAGFLVFGNKQKHKKQRKRLISLINLSLRIHAILSNCFSLTLVTKSR